MIELGGNISLVGFKELDGGTMVILKKLIGNHVRNMGQVCKNFEGLTLTMKKVHNTQDDKGHKFEVHGKVLDNGAVHVAEVTDFNIFMTVDKVLEKIQTGINK